MSTVQIKPAVITWTFGNNSRHLLPVTTADVAMPPAETVTVRWGGGFATRHQIADALREMAQLIEGTPGFAMVSETLP